MLATTHASLTPNVLRYGSEEPLPDQIPLRAGPLQLLFEDGDLRTIRLGNREILRRVYVAVRDHNWNTIPLRLTNVEMEVQPQTFRIAYDAHHHEGPIDFSWHGNIIGDQSGTITFTMDGAANSTFHRNRIGFCVLHPVSPCAGEPCLVEHADGTTEEGMFPDQISPHQPFYEIKAITHTVVPGLRAEVRFDGDIFEMEDQRNWTDASYKTYCTPLRLPYPVEIEAGTRVAQSVTMTLQGDIPHQNGVADEPITFTVSEERLGPLPRIGLGVASDGRPLDEQERTRIKALNPSHIRLDLRLFEPGYAERFEMIADEARTLGLPLEVALLCSDAAEDELANLLPVVERLRPAVRSWLIFPTDRSATPEQWARRARAVLTRYDPEAVIGGGTNAYFTQLNRDRPVVSALDAVGYSINPQVHAFDNMSLAENLEAQAVTVRSARDIIGNLPLFISPVTFRPRFNPDATGRDADPSPGQLPSNVDARQMSLFGAAWTVGSLRYLAQEGVQSITYYETAGWRGVMERPEGSSMPEKFRSLPGSVFPLYHVLADAGEWADGAVLGVTASHPLHIDGFALRQGDQMRIVLANLRNVEQEVLVRGVAAQVEVRVLDESNVVEAMRHPEHFRAQTGRSMDATDGTLRLSLAPYAVVRLDGRLTTDN